MKTLNPAAQALGKLGGKARAENLSEKELSAIATKAAQARWKNHKSKKTLQKPSNA